MFSTDGRAVLLGIIFLGFFFPLPAQAETLQQAWALAYQNNPSLEAERANLRATDEQVSQALSHWRPSIDATGDIGRTSQFTPDFSPFLKPNYTSNSAQYGVQATQPLFRGFRTKAETEEAEKQVRAERAKLQSAEQQLFLDTASAYLGILRDQAVLDIQRDHETVLQDKLRETNARTQAGDLTQTDTRQAESRMARARVTRFQVENSLTQDKNAYVHLVGIDPNDLKPAALPDEKPELATLLEKAETHNPDVIAAQFAVQQAEEDIRLNRGSLLPEVSLVGNSSRSYGQSITVPGRDDTSQVLLQVTVPLYRSGTDYSKTRAAEQTYTQRKMELNDARRKAHEKANNAWQALRTAQAALEADTLGVDAASKALEGVKVESRVGTRTTLDVLNAEQELLDAKVEMVRSQFDRDTALLQIKAAIGELTTEHLQLPVIPYDPRRHYEDVKNKWIGFSKDDERYKVEPVNYTEPK